MARDWFRKHDWEARDEPDFFLRLARARASNRPQYLRIQAHELMATGRDSLLKPAIRLLDRCLSDYPDTLETTEALSARAECFQRLGQLERAVDDYQAALERQRRYPNVISTAAQDFAWMVAVAPLPELYEEALNALAEWRPDHSILPIVRYRCAAARALILAALGRDDEASPHARIALMEAARKESGLRFHRFVGLVSTQEGRFLWRLRCIAGMREHG